MYLAGQTLIVQKDEDGVLRVKKSSSSIPSTDSEEQEDEDGNIIVILLHDEITYT